MDEYIKLMGGGGNFLIFATNFFLVNGAHSTFLYVSLGGGRNETLDYILTLLNQYKHTINNVSWKCKKKMFFRGIKVKKVENCHKVRKISEFILPIVPRKSFGSSDCDTLYNIYLSLCGQSADPNPFRGTD